MNAMLGRVDTDSGPPTVLPLRHFVVGLGFLLLGVVVALLAPLGVRLAQSSVSAVHLLLAGWVCVTILGAVTQFVPVWSGVPLYSRRLARLQLPLVAGGLAGVAAAFLLSVPALLPVAGLAALAGFWTFVANAGLTLRRARPWDVTERHFALALACVVLVPLLGILLGLSYAGTTALPVSFVALRATHATLAVFGVVLATVVGALSQLAPLFTQCADHPVDRPLRLIEEASFPAGVVLLAVGRVAQQASVARVGGLLVVVGLFAFGVALLRRLLGTRAGWTPMLSHYVVAVLALLAWTVTTLPTWLGDPLAPTATVGRPGLGGPLLAVAVGSVVVGTLYHVIPFLVWVEQYSDQLGLASVPSVDDLYDDRLATAELVATTLGAGLVVAGGVTAVPALVTTVGGLLVLGGVGCLVWNLLTVLRNHAAAGLRTLLVGGEGRTPTATEGAETTETTEMTTDTPGEAS